tara:strand:+ start:53 stop:256 length:204 start_codon:yes stop_codon:yes gene_type:complete
MEQKYPYLVNDKEDMDKRYKKTLSWKEFYLINVYYIAKLKEEYNTEYTEADARAWNPGVFYHMMKIR